MRLSRCHVNVPLILGNEIILPELVANHLLRVLRLCEGDTCVLFNGDGHDYLARLIATGRREAWARIEGVSEVCNESPLAITLVQAIARGEKMDLIVQKATELGVVAIVPVDTERSGVRLDSERVANGWHTGTTWSFQRVSSVAARACQKYRCRVHCKRCRKYLIRTRCA